MCAVFLYNAVPAVTAVTGLYTRKLKFMDDVGVTEYIKNAKSVKRYYTVLSLIFYYIFFVKMSNN